MAATVVVAAAVAGVVTTFTVANNDADVAVLVVGDAD